MALQVALTETNVGVPAPEAYAKIVAIRSAFNQPSCEVAVDIFFNLAARQAGKAPIAGNVLFVPAEVVEGNDPTRTTLYAWLKTLELFKDAVDA